MSYFQKEALHFRSADGKTNSAMWIYTPAAYPKAVIQLSHGMCEYIGRYERMIDVLAAAGYAVSGNDHLGHGDTSPDSRGFIAEKDGCRLLLADLLTVNQITRERFPDIPYFLLGHSMGSFLARWFAEINPRAQDALILSGTGGPSPLMPVGKQLARLLSAVRGPGYVSKFMVKVSTGSYSRGIEDTGSPSVWLSRDPAVWKAYDGDEKCNFSFTVSAYRDLLTAYTHVNAGAWAKSLRKDMPVLLYAGDNDPVGDYGRGVTAVYQRLRAAGMADVSIRLYPGGRHEMHNEINREAVFDDLIAWCDRHAQGEKTA